MSKKRKPISPSLGNDAEKQEKLIQKLRQDGEEASTEDEKGTVRITIDIPKPFHKKIKAYTKARGQTIKGYLLWLASQDMENQ